MFKLRRAHLAELKRRDMKATDRTELYPEQCMLSTTDEGVGLHSYVESGYVHHMLVSGGDHD